MSKQILVPIDQGPQTVAVLEEAAKLALREGPDVEVTVIYVARFLVLEDEISGFDLQEALEAEAHTALGLARTVFQGARCNFRSRFLLGDPVWTICDLARNTGTDLIVVGSRAWGSAVGRMVKKTPCPLHIVP